MTTANHDNQVFNLVNTFCNNYANCNLPAWGIIWKPTNGALYISNRIDWFTTESERDAKIQKYAA